MRYPSIAVLCLLTVASYASAAQDGVLISVEKRMRLQAAGEADVWIWTAPPALQVEQRGSTLLVDGPAGRYRVQVTGITIDWESKSVVQRTGFVDVELGNPPLPPGPGPNPPGPGPVPPAPDEIPSDEFDDIGRRAYQWLALVPDTSAAKASQLGDVYARTADGLESGDLVSINDSNQYLAEQRNQALDTQQLADDWSTWRVRVGDDLSGRSLDRNELVRYYRALAVGLRGGR